MVYDVSMDYLKPWLVEKQPICVLDFSNNFGLLIIEGRIPTEQKSSGLNPEPTRKKVPGYTFLDFVASW
jgi:hypothetical protein